MVITYGWNYSQDERLMLISELVFFNHEFIHNVIPPGKGIDNRKIDTIMISLVSIEVITDREIQSYVRSHSTSVMFAEFRNYLT